MEIIDAEKWISLTKNKNEVVFRQAVHTVLVAVSNSKFLNQQMCMKGGILLSLVYRGIRHTRDIDFSTAVEVAKFDEAGFLEEFRKNLANAVESLPYGLDCKIQSHEMRPPATAGHTHPTYKLKIGYALKSDTKKHRRLLNSQCPTVVVVDYSFNEPNYEHTEELRLQNGGSLLVYSLIDLLAEKLRAVLQQEVRDRVRRQDMYDIYCLLKEIGGLDKKKIRLVYESLLLKAKARNLAVDENSLNKPEIKDRSKREYYQLAREIEGDLPDFEIVYEYVRNFYINLPWLI